MKNYVLHFIRHGRTEHQRQGVYMGRRTGSELSAEGIGELLALRREYDYPSAEVVFSSPLPHCLQTADFLYPESRLMVVDELAEMDFGVYEGKSLEELKAVRDRVKGSVHLRQDNSHKTHVVVGMATCGIAAGARPVLAAFVEEIEKNGLENVTVAQTGCIGICQYEPIVEVFDTDGTKTTYVKMTPEKAAKVVSDHLMNGKVVTEYTIGSADMK